MADERRGLQALRRERGASARFGLTVRIVGKRRGLLRQLVTKPERLGLSISEVVAATLCRAPSKERNGGNAPCHLNSPAGVRAGGILRYTVALSNRSNAAVTPHPCPGYTQGLYTATAVVRRSFALTCSIVRAIPAHGRVRYAMRLPVPRRAKSGYAKLGWSLNTPTGPFVGRVVRVVSG
jgi:hypothetical protein